MPVYLGTLGRMVKLPYVGSQQVQSEERYNFASTLEGKRKAQVKPKGTRTWALSADHYRPNEHSLLSQFADGAWGPGPFVFVSADAPVSNMLLPGVADCLSSENPSGLVLDGGPVQVNDAWFARSYLNSSGVTVFFGKDHGSGAVPVIAGRRVTGSVHVTGSGARVQLSFYDAAGASLGSSLGNVAGVSGWVRSSVSVLPPAGAVSARVFANSATVRATGPAITWSDGLLPWGSGQGCSKAVVHGVTRDQVLAVQGHTYSNVGFTVSEVG